MPPLFATPKEVVDDYLRGMDDAIERNNGYTLAREAIEREIEVGRTIHANKVDISVV